MQTITVAGVGSMPGFTAVQNYDYDPLNRIQIATENIVPTGESEEPSWRQSFSYDRFGNRNFVTTGATATTTLGTCPAEVCNPTISPNTNKLTSAGYLFDAAGNTTRDAQNRKFTYDAENKQTNVESLSPGTQTVTGAVGEYWYDGDGKRIKKRAYENGVLREETTFVYDAAGKLVGEYSNQVASQGYAKVAYLTNDHLGSPRINTDINGNVTARQDYHPFGDEIVNSRRANAIGYAADTVRKEFTGYERDGETELDFAQARYLNSRQGRFCSTDPVVMSLKRQLDPQQINLFLYARNNPLAFRDIDGEEVVATGEEAERFRKDLEKATGLEITRDKETGKLSVTGKIPKNMSEVAKHIKNIIDDPKNVVTISAINQEAGPAFGKFEGDGKQTINYAHMDQAAKAGKGGLNVQASVVHEVAEAYDGLTNTDPKRGFNDFHSTGLHYENLVRKERGLGERNEKNQVSNKFGNDIFVTVDYTTHSLDYTLVRVSPGNFKLRDVKLTQKKGKEEK